MRCDWARHGEYTSGLGRAEAGGPGALLRGRLTSTGFRNQSRSLTSMTPAGPIFSPVICSRAHPQALLTVSNVTAVGRRRTGGGSAPRPSPSSGRGRSRTCAGPGSSSTSIGLTAVQPANEQPNQGRVRIPLVHQPNAQTAAARASYPTGVGFRPRSDGGTTPASRPRPADTLPRRRTEKAVTGARPCRPADTACRPPLWPRSFK